MTTDLVINKFNINDIKLENIYSNISNKYKNILLDSLKIQEVYGSLLFPNSPENQPYLYTSLVSSIDGKINFSPDNKDAMLIAQGNKKDRNGGIADFWILNMLRSISDAVIVGPSALDYCEKPATFIYDKDLRDERIKNESDEHPITIITSREGKTIPTNQEILRQSFPLILITSTKGLSNIKKNNSIDICEISGYQTILDVEESKDLIRESYMSNKTKKLIVISSDINKDINHQIAMKILKVLGINYISVESAHYSHVLLQNKLLHEIFLNYSGIYIGGDGIGVASNSKGFSKDYFPHSKMISMHIHSPYFIYTRQEFIY